MNSVPKTVADKDAKIKILTLKKYKMTYWKETRKDKTPAQALRSMFLHDQFIGLGDREITI